MKSLSFLSPEFRKDILRQKIAYDGPCGQWTCGPFVIYSLVMLCPDLTVLSSSSYPATIRTMILTW